MVPELPIDVVESIIDQFAPTDGLSRYLLSESNYQALLSCALTCRLWLERSRYHLRSLDDILIRSSEQLQKMSRTLNSSLTEQHRIIPATNMLLADAFSHTGRGWVHLVPLILGKNRLRRIRSLYIINAMWNTVALHHAVFLIGFSMFVQVTSLHLRYCTFSTFGQFQHLLRALPALQALSLECVKAASIPSPLQLLPETRGLAQSRSQLSTIVFMEGADNDSWGDCYRLGAALSLWLASSPSPHASKWDLTISVEGQSEDAEAEARTLVQDIGPSLDCLTVSYDTARTPLGFDLSRNRNLRTCAIELLDPNDLDWTLDVHMPQALRSLPEQNQLERLNISVHLLSQLVDDPRYRFLSRKELHQWRRVVEALDAKHFPQLQRLDLYFYIAKGHTDIPKDEALAELEAASAPLRERGVNVSLDFWENALA